MEKYVQGVQWIRELLYQTQFTAERMKIIATKMVNDVSQLKRNGRYIVQTLFKEMTFNKGVCTFRSSRFLRTTFQFVKHKMGDCKCHCWQRATITLRAC